MKKNAIVLFGLVLSCFVGQTSFSAVDFEKCRKELEVSESSAANADNTGPFFTCRVKLLSKNSNPGNACTAEVTFQTICTNSEQTVSWGGGACCE